MKPCTYTPSLHIAFLRRSRVDTSDESVVTLEGLERQLLLGLDAHFPHLVDLRGEDGFGGSGGIDTVGLDGDQDTTTGLEEKASVVANNTSLVCAVLDGFRKRLELN